MKIWHIAEIGTVIFVVGLVWVAATRPGPKESSVYLHAKSLSVQIDKLKEGLDLELQNLHDCGLAITLGSSVSLRIEKLGALKAELNGMYQTYPDLKTMVEEDDTKGVRK